MASMQTKIPPMSPSVNLVRQLFSISMKSRASHCSGFCFKMMALLAADGCCPCQLQFCQEDELAVIATAKNAHDVFERNVATSASKASGS